MAQQNYTFAPRGQQPPPQQQPAYQQYPNMAPQQPAYQQPPPQQVYTQNGFYPQMQVAQPQDGSAEFRSAYNKNLKAWVEANNKVKAGPTSVDAESNLEKMSQIVENINGTSEQTQASKTENLNEFMFLLTKVIDAIDNPEDWIPVERAKEAQSVKNSKLARSLSKYLNLYKDVIKTLG